MKKRNAILVADADRKTRTRLAEMFSDNFYILEAGNGEQAKNILERSAPRLAAALLDTSLELNGCKLLEQLDRMNLEGVALIAAFDYGDVEGEELAARSAVHEVITKSLHPALVRRRVGSMIDMRSEKLQMEERIRQQTLAAETSNERMIAMLSSVIEHRSAESGQHVLRIRRFTEILLRELAVSCPEYGLEEQDISAISSAASLHDIGKIVVPEAILTKPGALTPEEMEVMRTHTVAGSDMLKNLDSSNDAAYMSYARDICRSHHERWDGRGYPDGLRGDAIPICAQVVGLADAYDALTSDRVYRKAVDGVTAANMILGGKCGVFSPRLIACFKRSFCKMERLSDAWRRGQNPEHERASNDLQPQRPMANALEIALWKYRTLLHHMNTTVMEIEYDRGEYDVIHSPEPELRLRAGLPSLQQAFAEMADECLHPDDRRFLTTELEKYMEDFFASGLWKRTRSYRVICADGGFRLYDEVILRVEKGQRRAMILWQRHGEAGCEGSTPDMDIRDDLGFYSELNKLMLDYSNDVIFEWDCYSDEIKCSNNWMKRFGYSSVRENASINIALSSHFHPDDIPVVLDGLRHIENGLEFGEIEVRIADARGRYIWNRIRAAAVTDKNGTKKVVGVIMDIDSQMLSPGKMLDNMRRDGLTKLYNKQASRSMMELRLTQALEARKTCVFALIDLDGFKEINDCYGHLFGDEVLLLAATEIRRLFRGDDIVGRVGGDEFTVFAENISSAKIAMERFNRLIRNIQRLNGEELAACRLSASVGLTFAPEHGTSYEQLFQLADKALYQVKNSGGGFCKCYSAEDTLNLHRSSVSHRIESENRPSVSGRDYVDYVFERLYSSSDVYDTIESLLEMAGRRTQASRVYIFENNWDNTQCSNTFEWCAKGIATQKENLQNLSYMTTLMSLEKRFNEHGIFYMPDVSKMPEHLRRVLEPQGVKSILLCAIRDNGIFRGYVGFDDCTRTRLWTQEQVDLLSMLGRILSVFLLKQRMQDRTRTMLAELDNVLNAQYDWIYIVDPKNHHLLFVNRRITETIPETRLGMKCYKILMGLDAPCSNCPFNAGSVGRSIVYNPKLGIDVDSAADVIHWEGEKVWLLTCRSKNINDAGQMKSEKLPEK